MCWARRSCPTGELRELLRLTQQQQQHHSSWSLAKRSTASSTGYRNIEFTYIPTYDLAGAKGVGNKEVVIGGKRVRVTGFHGFQELPSSDLDT